MPLKQIKLLFISISFSLSLSSSDLSKNEYLVKSGDTLWSISRSLNVSIGELIELNKFKSYKSGIPIINVNQKIKFYRTSSDDIRDYCYSEYTWDGVNFSKELSKRDIITTCTFNLLKVLDSYVTGKIDSWHMSEKAAKAANEPIGIQLSWQGSKTIKLDEKFWEIYFSDIRYSYYFYNLSFASSQRDNTNRVMFQAALRGDSIAADHILDFSTYYYEIFPSGYKTLTDFMKAVIENQDKNVTGYLKETKYSNLYLNNEISRAHEGSDKSLKFKYDQLSHRYKGEFLFHQLNKTYKSGSQDYYKLRNEAIEYVQKSTSKLLTWYELAMVANIMYHAINTGMPEIGLEISLALEKRMELDQSEGREAAIYNGFIKNIYFDEEYSGMSIILIWILNISSSLQDIYPTDLKSFMSERIYLLGFVKEAHKKGHISDSDLDAWNSDTGAKLIELSAPCSDAEAFYKLAFNNYNKSINIEGGDRQLLDAFQEPLLLARCFIHEKNVSKSQLYYEQSSKYYSMSKSTKVFFQSFMDLTKAQIYILKNDYQDAYNFLEKSSNNIFSKNRDLSYTLNRDLVSQYVNDYINIYSELESMGFNMKKIRNYIELEGLKTRILSDGRLEKIKIDNNKKNIASLKDNLSTNKKEINRYEDLLQNNFEAEYVKSIDRLYLKRTKIMAEMLFKNKELDALFNPSYTNYIKIAKNIDQSSLIITYNLASDGGTLVAKTDTETYIFKINETKKAIQKNIKALRDSTKDTNSDFAYDAASYLYGTLIKPLEKILKNRKNIYIYGSELEDLPFGILLTNHSEIIGISNKNQKMLSANWLIERYSFARIFPLSNNKLNTEYDYKYLGIANPDSFEELGLPNLPNAEDEIRQIGLSSQSYSNEFLLTKANASKENLIEKLSDSYERLVFATHSVPPNWNGITNEGALILSDKGGDYLLTATEIVNLDINSDIVVLSSCSTEEKGSDSIYKSFLVAGTNSVMYTNWDLETVSAEKITDKVFKSILFDGLPKHQALQKASIEIMNDYSNPIYAHPAFWGNFSIAYRSL